MPLDLEEVGDKEQGDEARTEQVDEEHIKHRCLTQQHEIDEVQADVQNDEEHLQRGKADGPLLEPQITEGDGLQRIERHHHCHHQQIVGMLCIPQRTTDRADKSEDAQQEHQCQRPHHCHHRREDGIGLALLIVGEAEQGGLHAECQYHENQRCIGIDVRADAIVARFVRHIVSVERYEQIIQESAYNTAQAINRGVFCE